MKIQRIIQGFNKYSKNITQSKQNGSAQAMLYALGLSHHDLEKPQVGIGTVWFEGNPCNSKLDQLSSQVKNSLEASDFLGMRFNTIGVSDGKTMGTKAMRYSLPSRELITDSMESIIKAEHYDGSVLIPGCDKNLPASAMALARINRPSFIIYGGSMKPQYHLGSSQKIERLDIVSSFEAYGRYIKGEIDDSERQEIVQNACHGSCGACSGFYTANTMSCILEVMGLTLPNSSSNMSLSKEKFEECNQAGNIMTQLMVNDIKPLDIMTRESFLNAVKFLTLIGGSTNGVIHLLAMARTAGVELTLDDFKAYEDLPVLTNMKPHGLYVMDDLNRLGGTSVLIKYLIDEGILDGDCITVTSKTLKENTLNQENIDFDQNIIFPLESAFKKTSHINILSGNMAPTGSVSKIYSEDKSFEGKAIVFDTEKEMLKALEDGKITEDHFIILRYQGESTGCPEMLTPTSALVGYFNARDKENKIPPFATDGRFSGGSTGVLVAHLPDAYKDNSVTALINDGDHVSIDINTNTIEVDVSEEELAEREKTIIKPEINLDGYLRKYKKLVSNLEDGYLT